MIGRISEQKGQEAVIDFFNGLAASEFLLSIYGAGMHDYVESLKMQVKNPNIRFQGFQERDFIYENTDFVIFNAKNESFGRVVAEANAYGIPVLAVASGALSEIVDDGINGYAFQNFEAFKSFFVRDIASAESLEYTTLSQSAQLFFKEKFSIEAYANTIFRELQILSESRNNI